MIFGSFFGKDKEYVSNMEDLKLKLLEDGKLQYQEQQILNLVRDNKLPFDEYQEFISDEKKHKSQVVKFCAQSVISASVIAFCMAMITIKSDSEGIYLPIISAILGYWLPSPDYSKMTEIRKKTTKPHTDNTHPTLSGSQHSIHTSNTANMATVISTRTHT
jgi:hypothetical protein